MEFEITNVYNRGGNKQIEVSSEYCEKEVFGFPIDMKQEEIEKKIINIFKERKMKKESVTNLKNKKFKI